MSPTISKIFNKKSKVGSFMNQTEKLKIMNLLIFENQKQASDMLTSYHSNQLPINKMNLGVLWISSLNLKGIFALLIKHEIACKNCSTYMLYIYIKALLSNTNYPSI